MPNAFAYFLVANAVLCTLAAAWLAAATLRRRPSNALVEHYGQVETRSPDPIRPVSKVPKWTT
jgi:hypothetical protein